MSRRGDDFRRVGIVPSTGLYQGYEADNYPKFLNLNYDLYDRLRNSYNGRFLRVEGVIFCCPHMISEVVAEGTTSVAVRVRPGRGD